MNLSQLLKKAMKFEEVKETNKVLTIQNEMLDSLYIRESMYREFADNFDLVEDKNTLIHTVLKNCSKFTGTFNRQVFENIEDVAVSASMSSLVLRLNMDQDIITKESKYSMEVWGLETDTLLMTYELYNPFQNLTPSVNPFTSYTTEEDTLVQFILRYSFENKKLYQSILYHFLNVLDDVMDNVVSVTVDYKNKCTAIGTVLEIFDECENIDLDKSVVDEYLNQIKK